MRILLVRPHPQLYIAKCLQKFLHLEPLELEIVAGGVPAGEEVSICDLSIERKPVQTFQNMLQKINPHIVGFTGYSSQAQVVKKLAKIVKEHDHSIVNVVGGIHATIIPVDYAVDDIDIVVRGEGGTAFREIIGRYKKGLPLNFGRISLSPKDPDFYVNAELPPPEYPGVKDIPAPRRDLVQRSRYFSVWTSSPEGRLDTVFPRIATIRTSYGCAFSCSFCVVPHIMNKKYLQREPEDVVDEIAGIEENCIYFVDDETFLNPKRMTEIANLLIRRGIKKRYVSWARSDTIVRHPELFRLWKEVGLSIVYVGLEAMDENRLKNYKKKTSVETNQKAVSLLKEIGITLHASLMVDPNFSVEDFRNLEKVVINLCPAEVSFTVYSPSPGTETWHKHVNDYICDSYLFYDCMHTILPTKIELKRFYSHFARLYTIAWRNNPLRINKIKVPVIDVMKSIYWGTKYIFTLRNIYKDYL